jgi:hypothetical protein
MDAIKAKELARFRDEANWPGDYIHVKTWPEFQPRRFGILYKGTFRVGVFKILGAPLDFENTPEQFASYEELVERWMGD